MPGPESLLIPHTLGPGKRLDSAHFPKERILTVSCFTDETRLTALLPPGIELLGAPTINFRYRYSEGLDWCLGGDHNAVGVSVPVCFRKGDEVLTGVHWLALWEDDAMAVILGREIFGVAKLYGDINAQWGVHDEWRAMLSEAGQPLIQIKYANPRPMEGAALEELQERARANGVIGWKQIPDVAGDNPVVSYPTYFPHTVKIDRAWRGEGSVEVFRADPNVNIWVYHVIEAIRRLPILEIASAIMTEGSAELKVAEGRRLD